MTPTLAHYYPNGPSVHTQTFAGDQCPASRLPRDTWRCAIHVHFYLFCLFSPTPKPFNNFMVSPFLRYLIKQLKPSDLEARDDGLDTSTGTLI